MMGLIFLGVMPFNVMPLSVFKVRIMRAISVRKSGRVEQFSILLNTELGSYVGFSITSGETQKS